MDEIFILLTNIIILRKSHKLSKKEMADIMGVSLYVLNRIEKEHYPYAIKINSIFKLSHYFGIPPHNLFKKIK